MGTPKEHKKRNPIARWLLTNRLQFGTKKTTSGKWYHRAREKRLFRKGLLALLILFSGAAFAPALGIALDGGCVPLARMARVLRTQFDESIVGKALIGSKTAEIWFSEENQTYTFTVTSKGLTCIVGFGILEKDQLFQQDKEIEKSS